MPSLPGGEFSYLSLDNLYCATEVRTLAGAGEESQSAAEQNIGFSFLCICVRRLSGVRPKLESERAGAL